MSLEDEHSAPEEDNTSSTESVSPRKPATFFQEQPPQEMEVAPELLRRWTRRDLLLFGVDAMPTAAGGGFLLPQTTLERWGIIRENKNWPKKERLLNKVVRIDDDVAEALYSKNRLVPTFTKSQITPLKNKYNGATPDASYIPEWSFILGGIASGLSVSLNIRSLLASFQVHEQITRLVCVEGSSAIARWAGLRFDDLLECLRANVPGEMGPIRIIGESRSLGKSRPLLRVARSGDGSSSANPARDSPEREGSHGRARSSVAAGCTCETGPEKHQGDYTDYLIRRMNRPTTGRTAGIHATTEFEYLTPGTTCGVNYGSYGSNPLGFKTPFP
jgi:hypothetical protein